MSAKIIWLVAVAAVAWPASDPPRAQAIDLSGGGPVQVTSEGGFDWHEADQEVVASGNARASRGTVTVLADRLVARYRKKAGSAPGTAASASSATPDTGDTEVYRLEADGNVRIVTPTDEARGDHAIYDIDQAVLVLTGKNMRITTPQDVMTARDSIEYWSQRHMAVARGEALVVTSDGRRLSADILVGYTTDNGQAGAAPKAAEVAAKTGGDPAAASGKLQRVEAFGNVEVRTTADTVRGERGVYVPDTGIARVVGHVRITHGQNQLNGPAADVDMKTGIAHMASVPGNRVEGLIVPNEASPRTPAKPAEKGVVP